MRYLSRRRLLAALLVVGWLPVQAASVHAAMQFKTGIFVGNGQDDRAITGLGFQPDVVLIKNGTQGNTVVRTSSMVGDISRSLGTGAGSESSQVKSLDTDGFTVGTDAQVNQNGVTIYWVAFQADPAELAVGSYVGNGANSRSITGIGFQPGYVMVMNQSGQQAVQRFFDQTGDNSRAFDTNGEIPNRIRSFDVDGFTVGPHNSVNETGQIIHYVAWGLVPGRIAAGTYTGNGADDRAVPGAGMRPLYMLLADESGASQPIQRFSSLSAGLSLGVAGGSAFGNAIQDFLDTGFEVGTSIGVNNPGTDYYWVAFGDQPNAADIVVQKAVDDPLPDEGDTLTYTVSVSNLGPGDATGIAVTDLLPSGLTYTGHGTTRGTYDELTGLWSVGAMTAGAADTLWLSARLDPGTGGSIITNTASVTAAEPDGNIANNTDSADVSPQDPLSFSVSTMPQGSSALLPGSSTTDVLRVVVTNTSSQTGTLSGLSLTNRTSGPGSPADLDRDWGTLTLLADDGNSIQTLGAASFSGGTAAFPGLNLFISAGETVDLIVRGGPSLTARDGDVLDLLVSGPGDLAFAQAAQITGAWPMDPPGSFPVDGMSAAQIGVNPVAGRSLVPGAVRELALDIVIPANGYQADVLNRLNVINVGTAEPGWDIEAMELWADAGQPGFNPAEDLLLGLMENTGNRWEVTGLSQALPPGGRRLFVSVNVPDQAFRTSSIQLAVPSGPDYGVGVASSNSGPLDLPVTNGQVITVTTQDRMVVAANPLSSGTVNPGQDGVVLTSIQVTNTYSVTQTLDGLTFANSTSGTGTQGERDQTTQLLTLHEDGNGNAVFDGAGIDPTIATGSFVGGSAGFTGFQIQIPPDASRSLFLVARVSSHRAPDGEILSALLADALDVSFSVPVAVTGIFPVDSGARWTVDGMVASQVQVYGGDAVTLGPGGGPETGLDLIIPANGYLDDDLNAIAVENTGTAAASDIAEVRLWLDGGDGASDLGAGDDSDLGAFSWNGVRWTASGLSVPLTGSGARFFVTAAVSPSFVDSADVRLSVPVGGITVSSSNDGPIDSPVVSPTLIRISDAPLLASLNFETASSTVGETVTVRMTVRNQSAEILDGVTPSAPVPAGTGSLTLQAGPVPASYTLNPTEENTFEWTYLAASPGTVTVTGLATGVESLSGQTRSSRETTSGTHTIYLEATELRVSPLTSMPATLAPGQTGVVPLTLTFTNPAGTGASDIELTDIRLRLEDENGAGIVPSTLLTRLEAREGQSVFQNKVALETSGSDIDLPLGLPYERALVSGGGQISLTFVMDLAASTPVSRFRVVITDATFATASDVNNGSPVTVTLENSSFPVRTGLATLVNEADQVQVTGDAPSDIRAGRGQTGVPLLVMDLENLAGPGVTSSVRVGGFALSLTDSNGTPLADLARVFDRLEVRSAAQLLYSQTSPTGPGDSLTVVLSPPVVLGESAPVRITISGDIAGDANLDAFQARLGPETDFDLRDVNTGNDVPAVYNTSPLLGNRVQVESEAVELQVAGTPLFPGTVSIGGGNIPALDIAAAHPGAPGTARIRVDTLLVQVKDGQGNTLVPASVLDRIQVLWDGQPLAEVTGPPSTAKPVAVPLPGLFLEAGETGTARVVVDIDAGAQVGSLQLSVTGSGFLARDANLGHPVNVVPQSGAELPLFSGVTQLTAPAREVLVGLESRMPAMLANDGQEVIVGTVQLQNPAAEGFSSIRIDHMVFRAADRTMNPVAAGRNARRISLYHDGILVGESGSLGPDSTTAWIPIPGGVTVGAEREESLEVRMTVRAGTAGSSFRLGYRQDDVGVVQPGGVLQSLQVRAESGQNFPMWTEAGSFIAMDLEDSYSNFPNPFAAGRENTSFTYYLTRPGTVTLKIWTLRGQEVVAILDRASRSQGLHQDDRWNGMNRRGAAVLNGVYLAELRVEYDDGSSRRLIRKVAVVR